MRAAHTTLQIYFRLPCIVPTIDVFAVLLDHMACWAEVSPVTAHCYLQNTMYIKIGTSPRSLAAPYATVYV
jgi:hypothetical protein